MAEKRPSSADLKFAAEMTAEAQLRRTGEIGEPVMVNGKTIAEWLAGEYADVRAQVLLAHVRQEILKVFSKGGN